MDKKKYSIITLILLLALLAQGFSANAKIQTLSDRISNLNMETRELKYEIEYLEQEFREQQERELYVDQVEHRIENLDGAYDKALVTTHVSLNRLEQSDEVSLMYRSIASSDRRASLVQIDNEWPKWMDSDQSDKYGEWHTASVTQTGDLSYQVQLELDYDYNYEMKLLVKHGEEKISEELDRVDLYTDTMPIYDLNVETERLTDSGELTFSAFIEYFSAKSVIGLESAVVSVLAGEEVLDSVDLLKVEPVDKEMDDYLMADYHQTISLKPSGSYQYQVCITDKLGRVKNFVGDLRNVTD